MSTTRTFSASAHFATIALTFSLAAFILLPFGATTVRAALPAAHCDWVCVADGALVAAYEPLAEHRRAQGLSPLVVDLEQVLLWSPAGDDTIASLRWLAGVAAHQWGARYLLLGGSHARLPAPLFRLAGPPADYINPTDAYYRCLGGDWDADGDGFVAEWGEDAPDPALDIVVGRVPIDESTAVAAFVAKVIGFERRQVTTPSALFVASHMSALSPPTPCPSWGVGMSEDLRDLALAAEPALVVAEIIEDCVPSNPLTDPLSVTMLASTLAGQPHDLAHFTLQGIAQTWQMANLGYAGSADFAPLAGTGHAFVATMLSGPVADTRGGNVLASLIALPDGGAVGAVAPACMGFIYSHFQFMRSLWSGFLLDDEALLGDVFQAALEAAQADATVLRTNAATYWGMCLLGDPAMRVWPVAGPAAADMPQPGSVAHLRVAPNPFNPTATIRFEVQAPAGTRPSVRVEIFDLQGRLVRTLLDESLPPGPREVNWHADAVSGVYLVRVTAGGDSAAAKLTLLE